MHYIRTFNTETAVQSEINAFTYESVYVAYLQDTDKFDYNTLRPQYPTIASLDGGQATSTVDGRTVDGSIADLDLI